MPNESKFDWDGMSPLITHPRRQGAGEIRNLRLSAGLRIDKEHLPLEVAIEGNPRTGGGEHREGSAVAYYRSHNSTPLMSPDGSRPLDNELDIGRLWVHDFGRFRYWNGGEWRDIVPVLETAGLQSLSGHSDISQKGRHTLSTPIMISQNCPRGVWFILVIGVTWSGATGDNQIGVGVTHEVSGQGSVTSFNTLHGHTTGAIPNNVPFVIPFVVTHSAPGDIRITEVERVRRISWAVSLRIAPHV